MENRSYLDVSFEFLGRKRKYVHLRDVDKLSEWERLEENGTTYRIHIARAPLYLGGEIGVYVYETENNSLKWDSMQFVKATVNQTEYIMPQMQGIENV